MNDLIFGGQRLSDLGFAIAVKPSYRIAQRNIEFQQVNGRDGDVIVDNEHYNNVDIEYQINTLSHLLKTKDPQLIAYGLTDAFFVNTGAYKRLQDTYNPDYFTQAIITAPEPLEQIGHHHFRTTLKFSRKPFWYSFVGQETITTNQTEFTIYNPEKIKSLPIIKVIGNGGFTLQVNNKKVKVSECNDYITIDSEACNVYKGDVDMNDVVTASYLPTFKDGKNTIAITPDTDGAEFTLEIIPNWRRL